MKIKMKNSNQSKQFDKKFSFLKSKDHSYTMCIIEFETKKNKNLVKLEIFFFNFIFIYELLNDDDDNNDEFIFGGGGGLYDEFILFMCVKIMDEYNGYKIVCVCVFFLFK